MKNTLIATVLFLFLSTNYLSGQNHDPKNKREQYESQKVAFISKHVNFTVQEAQLFWPHYNEMQEKRTDIQIKLRGIIQKIDHKDNGLSDNDLEKLSDELMELRLNEVQVEKVYQEKFKSVLPIKKVLKYYQAEVRFKTFFVRQMRDNNRQNMENRQKRNDF